MIVTVSLSNLTEGSEWYFENYCASRREEQ